MLLSHIQKQNSSTQIKSCALNLTDLKRFKEWTDFVTLASKTILCNRKPWTNQLPSTFLRGHHCRTCVWDERQNFVHPWNPPHQAIVA